ncbi:MAG: DUF2007 domain-containing protein [Bacteroidales bacterium]|nr:DUF2007 domain-containing protein [Bacteroidales bacterium]
MEAQLYKVFSGLAIDVNIVKKHLEKNSIKCYVENRNGSDNKSEWSESGFDPYVDLKVEEDKVESAINLIEEFLNTKAE